MAALTMAAMVPAASAGAAFKNCTGVGFYDGKVSRVSSIVCSSTPEGARAWIKYYANDSTTVVSRSNSPFRYSGSTSVTRPTTSFKQSGGWESVVP